MSGEVTSKRSGGNANSKDHYQAALGPLYNQRVIDAIDNVNINTISDVYERRCDVFLLHDGENLEVIKEISSALQDRCLRVNSGIPQLNDFHSFSNEKLYEEVIHAVGQAHCVVICITRALVRHIENVIPTTHAANACQMAFTYAKQHTGLSNMVPVVMSKDMRDSTLWGGQIGRVTSGKVRVDLSEMAKFSVRMNELHNLILLTNGSSIHQALFNLHENSKAAPSIAPLSMPTATPNKSSVRSTTVLINTEEDLHVIEKGMVKDLADFVIANTTMSEMQAYELARKLVFNGVGSVEKLEKKALRSETYLNAFLSDPDDVKELRVALEMEITDRIMQPRSNAFVHESAAESACAHENTATSKDAQASNPSLSSSSSYRSSYPYKFAATDYEDVFQLYVRSRIYGKADAKKQLEELAESYASAYDYNDSGASGVGGDGYGLGFGAFRRMRRDVHNLVEPYGDAEQHHCEQALNASQNSIDSNSFDTPMTQTPPSTPPLRQHADSWQMHIN
eukprot:gene23803-28827_t